MNWSKPIVLVSLLVLLGACSTFDTVKTTVKAKGAKVAVEVLTDAEWVVCRAAPVGAVKDRYGQTVERADTYKEFCEGDGKANVISPE